MLRKILLGTVINSFIFSSVYADPATIPTAQPDSAATAPANNNQPKTLSDIKDKDLYRRVLFQTVYEIIKAKYVKEVDEDKLIEGAIKGMLSSLDPHSAFYSSKDFAELRNHTDGKFLGIGAVLVMEEGLVKVVSPIEDSPAFKAGIEAGDYITHVNSEPVIGWTLEEVVEKIRGENLQGDKIGTEVKLKIFRKNKSLEVTIKRDNVKIIPVKSRNFDDEGVAYIRITTFNENTEDALKKAINEAKEKLKTNLKGIVLDLRNNPGGHLNQAIAVSNMFLDGGMIVSIRGRDKDKEEKIMSKPNGLTKGIPLVVLVNGGSASASEIVAGAVKGNKRGIVMGTTTFGKGSVQEVIDLKDRGVKITVAFFYPPDSTESIQTKGVQPDIVVNQIKFQEIEDEERFKEKDYKDALKPEEIKEKEEIKKTAEELKKNLQKEKKTDPKSDKKETTEKKTETPEEKILNQDYQLLRAIELVKTLKFLKTQGN